jgi:hypothetical protein
MALVNIIAVIIVFKENFIAPYLPCLFLFGCLHHVSTQSDPEYKHQRWAILPIYSLTELIAIKDELDDDALSDAGEDSLTPAQRGDYNTVESCLAHLSSTLVCSTAGLRCAGSS